MTYSPIHINSWDKLAANSDMFLPVAPGSVFSLRREHAESHPSPYSTSSLENETNDEKSQLKRLATHWSPSMRQEQDACLAVSVDSC